MHRPTATTLRGAPGRNPCVRCPGRSTSRHEPAGSSSGWPTGSTRCMPGSPSARGMTVLGGLESSTWSPAGPGLRSVLVPSAKFRRQGTLLSAAAGAVTLSGIELRDGAGRAATLLSLAGTALAARDVSFLVQGEGTRTALAASASTVTISDSLFTAERAGAATLAAVSGGTMTITGCTFSGPAQAVDFTCLSATDAARVVVTGGSFDPGSGLKVRGIRAAGSIGDARKQLALQRCGQPRSSRRGPAGGTFLARNCDFAASAESVVPACLIADGAIGHDRGEPDGGIRTDGSRGPLGERRSPRRPRLVSPRRDDPPNTSTWSTRWQPRSASRGASSREGRRATWSPSSPGTASWT